MDRYLQRRWDRALEFRGSEIQPVHEDADGLYRVQSSRGGHYATKVVLAYNGQLSFALCHCADHGETKWHGVPVCKHTLAAAMYLHLKAQGIHIGSDETIREAWARLRHHTQ